ncbi:MAG TPA: hypothetical protein VNE21_02260, partial [Mycobacteriales bacterium]|nr:hypothetical protein [Mycobacteriales bacterium]
PYVGRLCPGLNIAAGHEGEGITYAPVTGAVMADLLLDGLPAPAAWNPHRTVRQHRGADGSGEASLKVITAERPVGSIGADSS